MFNESKYTNWYCLIIANALNTKKEGYTERHHIVPRSLGGDDSDSNLVRLTAREHFVVHWLLTKMVEGDARRKMAYALKMLMNAARPIQQRHKVIGRTYELTKLAANNYLQNREFHAEWREKLSVSAKARAALPSEKIRRSALAKRLISEGKFKGAVHYSGKENTFAKEETKAKIQQRMIEIYGVTNPALVPFKCEHCGYEGKGIAGYKRWHGNNCRQKETLCLV